MFVVKDICKILGLSNVTATLRNIPDKWKCSLKVNTSTQGLQTSNVVNEAVIFFFFLYFFLYFLFIFYFYIYFLLLIFRPAS
jgi:hypothetical protein